MAAICLASSLRQANDCQACCRSAWLRKPPCGYASQVGVPAARPGRALSVESSVCIGRWWSSPAGTHACAAAAADGSRPALSAVRAFCAASASTLAADCRNALCALFVAALWRPLGHVAGYVAAKTSLCRLLGTYLMSLQPFLLDLRTSCAANASTLAADICPLHLARSSPWRPGFGALEAILGRLP